MKNTGPFMAFPIEVTGSQMLIALKYNTLTLYHVDLHE